MNEPVFEAIGAVAAALALGFVVSVTVVVGRIAFRVLSEDDARSFLRALFHVYYIALISFLVVGAAALALPRPVDAGVLGAVAIVTAFAWAWLTPIAHRLDDLRREGQDVAKELVRIQGRGSFIIVAQIVSLTVVVIRLATVPA